MSLNTTGYMPQMQKFDFNYTPGTPSIHQNTTHFNPGNPIYGVPNALKMGKISLDLPVVEYFAPTPFASRNVPFHDVNFHVPNLLKNPGSRVNMPFKTFKLDFPPTGHQAKDLGYAPMPNLGGHVDLTPKAPEPKREEKKYEPKKAERKERNDEPKKAKRKERNDEPKKAKRKERNDEPKKAKRSEKSYEPKKPEPKPYTPAPSAPKHEPQGAYDLGYYY